MKIKKVWQQNKLVILEIAVFLLVFLVIWLDEFIDLPYLLFHASPSPHRIEEYLFETFSLLILGIITISITLALQKRIRRLELYLRICAWCNKVFINNEWIYLEDYLAKKHNLTSTHGICPNCKQRVLEGRITF